MKNYSKFQTRALFSSKKIHSFLLVLICIFFWTNAYANKAEITLTIKRLQAKSTDSCNEKMDFYAKTSIDNKSKKQTAVKEGNNISPNWKNRQSVSATGRKRILIEIMDEDDTFCGGGDDIVDVSPLGEDKLLLYVDVTTNKIYNSQNKEVGRVGRDLTFSGSSYRNTPRSGGNVETGSITLRVDVKKSGGSSKKLTLTIESLAAKTTDACNKKMDFYAKTKIGNNKTRKTAIKEGNFIKPNWKNTATISGKTRVVVEIWDEDDALCGGGDDKVDVNPSKDNFLYLYVDPVKRKVYKDKNFRSEVGSIGQLISMEGGTYNESNGSGPNFERGKIKFRIDLR